MERKISPPVSCAASPLVRGGLKFAKKRICGGEAPHENKRQFQEPIGVIWRKLS